MKGITLLEMFQHTRICFTELLFIESITETFSSLGHLFIYFFIVLGNLVFDKNICAVTFFRITVVDKGIIESIDMSGSFPYRRMHKDGRIKTHDILVQ